MSCTYAKCVCLCTCLYMPCLESNVNICYVRNMHFLLGLPYSSTCERAWILYGTCALCISNGSSQCAFDMYICMHVLCVKSSGKENCFQFQLLPAFVAQSAHRTTPAFFVRNINLRQKNKKKNYKRKILKPQVVDKSWTINAAKRNGKGPNINVEGCQSELLGSVVNCLWHMEKRTFKFEFCTMHPLHVCAYIHTYVFCLCVCEWDCVCVWLSFVCRWRYMRHLMYEQFFKENGYTLF